MTTLRLTIRAHHALSRLPLEEIVSIPCASRRQVAAALNAVHHYCRSLIGRGTIRRVEILRERI